MKTLLILIALSMLGACSSNVKLEESKTAAERQQELLQKRQDARSRN